MIFVERRIINSAELASLEVSHACASTSLLCWAEVALLGDRKHGVAVFDAGPLGKIVLAVFNKR